MEPKENMSSYDLDVRDIVKELKLIPQVRPVSVYAIAISKIIEKNATIVIPAEHGKPISSFVYDATKDYFLIRGVSYMHIGEISISYTMCIDAIIGWQADVPITEAVLKRHISESDFKDYENWKIGFEKDRCTVSLIQILKSH